MIGWAALALALCTIACEGRRVSYDDEPPLLLQGSAPLKAASGGVIVDNPAPDTLIPAFILEHQPLIRVGGRNDENNYQELWVVRNAVLTTSGRLAVIMDAGREVRVFDQQNKFLHTIGRAGEGPGEFRIASSLLSLPGDSVMLYSSNSRRINVYSSDGKYARWVRGRSEVLCCFVDGAFLTRAWNESDLFSREFWPAPRAVVDWAIAGEAGQVVPASETHHPARRVVALEESDRGARIAVQSFMEGFQSRIPPRYAPVPFARTANVRIAGDNIVYGIGDRFEYQVFSRDGELLRTVRADVAPVELTRADRARARDAFISEPLQSPSPGRKLTPEQIKRWYSRGFDELELPKTMPAYGRIRTEEDGSVWVSRYIAPGDSIARQWWAKFDANGKLLGTLHIPQKQTVVRFTRGHVIVRYEDARDGFHILSAHRILPQ